MNILTKQNKLFSETLTQINHIKSPYFDDDLFSQQPNYKLILILKGYGKRYGIDKVEDFNPYDLILLKKDVMYTCKCDDIFLQGHQKLNVEAIIMKFDDEILENISLIPESFQFINFIKNMEDVVIFDVNKAKKIKPLLLGGLNKEGLEKMSIILQIFHILCDKTCENFFCENMGENKENNTTRMTRVIDFTRKNFKNKICIDEVSKIANLTPSAFCRYFKKEKGKHYIDYVNELRIIYASELLKTTEMSVTQIALETGFENLSHFFNVFKKIVKKTPLRYRKM